MKQLYIAINIFLLFSFITPSSYAGEFGNCDFFAQDIEVNLSTTYGYLTYDHTKDTKYISNLAKSSTNTVLGLAKVSKIQNASIDAEVVNSNGLHCWVPKKINFYIGYEKPRIFITKKAAEMTCEYDHIRRHEQVHMQVHAAVLESFLPAIYAFLYDYSEILKPFEAKTQNELDVKSKKIQTDFLTRALEIYKIFSEKSEYTQKLIDNVENYKYEGTICR